MSLNKNNIKIKNKDRSNRDYEELFLSGLSMIQEILRT